MSRRVWGAAGLAAVGAIVSWAIFSVVPKEHPPNVLIVLWDTARADRMSLYGHEHQTTPRLDMFAARAAVYDAAMSPGMWTVPSHGSLFTGLSTSSHGAKVGWLWLDGHYVTLAEHFGANGYATFAFSSNPYLSDQTNLLQGFDTVGYSWRAPYAERCAEATRAKLLAEDQSTEISPAWVATEHAKGWPKHLTTFKDSGPVAADAFLTWVDGRGQTPFFAYLNLLEAHHPRVPSRPAREATADAATIERALRTDASLFRIMSAMEGEGSFAPDELSAMAATYDATLWDLDRVTATITDGLAARGLLEETIVIITSDHGENLGENGMFDHRWDLHQTLLHVPLVVRYPKKVAPGRITKPVSTSHLFGTLLALTGLPAPDVSHALPPLGDQEHVFSELEAPTPRLAEILSAWPGLAKGRWQRRYRAIFEGPYKLQRDTDGGIALYDLAADPHESSDIGSITPEITTRLTQALSAWDKGRSKYDPAQRTGSDHPGNPLKSDPADREMLKALGYEEDEESP